MHTYMHVHIHIHAVHHAYGHVIFFLMRFCSTYLGMHICTCFDGDIEKDCSLEI